MFSRKIAIIAGLIVLLFFYVVAIFISAGKKDAPHGSTPYPSQLILAVVAPFQKAVTKSSRFVEDIWNHYFFLISVAKENEELKKSLSQAIEKNNECKETQLSNLRLRTFLNFQKKMTERVLAAEVIAKDPSDWFKTITIDKGASDGVKIGRPVVVPEGVVGQIIETSKYYSRVLLIIDRNSAVDGLIQRTRARGIIKGAADGHCIFKYVLRKHDIHLDDTIVSSGLDGVFPKGLRIGRIVDIDKENLSIFQEVMAQPFVDFEKLEEVLVILTSPPLFFEEPS